MAEERVQRRLAAILAADVVGYSRLMGNDEVETRARFNAHLHDLIEPAVANHQGRIVKTLGDGLLIEFASVVDAVQCAVDIQNGMAERNADAADDRRMDFRIGINLGDIIVEGDDIHGDGVNVAARLEGLAEPGNICISRAALVQVRDKLSHEFVDLGEVEVKNISRPIRVYQLAVGGTPAPSHKGIGRRRLAVAKGMTLALVVLIGGFGGWFTVSKFSLVGSERPVWMAPVLQGLFDGLAANSGTVLCPAC